jgi:hypothetical protein
MSEEKKATEVLQEIKLEVGEILLYVKNIDFKYNLILDRLNKYSPSIENQTIENQTIENKIEVPLPSISDNNENISFPEYVAKPKSPFIQSPNLKEKLQLAIQQAQKSEQNKSSGSEQKKKSIRQSSDPERQIAVQQRIAYPDGKNIYMASVDIYNAFDKKLIKQTKTDQVGKWRGSLSPGEYIINISKASNALKPKVELSYSVTVPNQDGSIEFETKIAE